MLSYQHAYHAGGPADVHKHMVLAELLTRLTAKQRGISYAETHAGRGLYDLAGAESAKTREAAAGISRLDLDADLPYGSALVAIRSRHGRRAYPGSPRLAAELLRPVDSLTLMELHPTEHAALRETMEGFPVSIHHRDGFEALLALAPLRPRRGLVLVDPSYEVKAEYEQAADFVRRLIAKWPEATIMIWYPILAAGRHRDLLDRLAPLAALRDEVRFTPAPPRGMTGSGIALVNAPYGSDAIFSRVHAGARTIFSPIPA
jgi:23S rRNA (adenine2030-N6)-methyltransferase